MENLSSDMRRVSPGIGPLIDRDSGAISANRILFQTTPFGLVMAGIGTSAHLLRFAFEDEACHGIAEDARRGHFAKAEALGVAALLVRLEDPNLRRLAVARAFLKASPDDPKHPGWPAGTADGKGGEFRPKDLAGSLQPNWMVSVSEDEGPRVETPPAIDGEILPPLPGLKGEVGKLAEKAIIDGVTRTEFREIFLKALGKLAASPLPVIGEIVDALSLLQLVVDSYKEWQDRKSAIEFIKSGPHTLDELRLSTENQSFSSYSAFRKDLFQEFFERKYGSAGDGNQYHHIVEQDNDNNSIPTEKLQSTENIIRIPAILHEAISAYYSSSMGTTGMTVRQWIQRLPYDQQLAAGIQILRMFHVII